jgi:hypothetical protein
VVNEALSVQVIRGQLVLEHEREHSESGLRVDRL